MYIAIWIVTTMLSELTRKPSNLILNAHSLGTVLEIFTTILTTTMMPSKLTKKQLNLTPNSPIHGMGLVVFIANKKNTMLQCSLIKEHSNLPQKMLNLERTLLKLPGSLSFLLCL